MMQTYKQNAKIDSVPRNFTVEQTRLGLEIGFRWANSSDRDTLFWGGAVLALLGLLGFFSGETSYMVFGTLALLLAAVNWDALFRNRTTVTFTPETLTVHSGPVPYLVRNTQLTLSDIQSVYLSHQYGLRGVDGQELYHLYARLDDGSRKLILRYVTREQAWFIAEQIRL